MKYQYKFLKVKTKTPEEEVEQILNQLGNEGWKLLNFHPTSDLELGSTGIFHKNEPWDVGYAFTFIKEVE